MLKSIVAAVALVAFAAPASAVSLVVDSGWYYDFVVKQGGNADTAPYSFSLDMPAFLRLTDTNQPGDVFTASDIGRGLSFTTAFATDGVPVPNYDEVAWSDLRFSRFSQLLGPGRYSFDVTTQCEVSCPAGFAIRLDTAPPIAPGVPEPASWALIITGFGLAGAATRRRRAVAAAG
jgi:hypothetical protein